MRLPKLNLWVRLAVSAAAWLTGQIAVADGLPPDCGNFRNNYGPFDYRVDKKKLPIVEHYHFTPEVEMLRRGATAALGGDIDYTLRAFPNHHRALMAMMRLAERERKEKPRGARYTVSCYMARAEAFRPTDGMVKMLAGIYLLQKGQAADAVSKLEAAEELDGGNANLHYNLGLAYFKLKKFDEALEQAHKAYALGFNLPGLRSMLEKAGKWRDPQPKADADS